LLALLKLFLLTLDGLLSAFILLFLNLKLLGYHPFSRREILHLTFQVFEFRVYRLAVFSRRRAERPKFAIRSIQVVPQLDFRLLQDFHLPVQGFILDSHPVKIAFCRLEVLQGLLVLALADDAPRHEYHNHQQTHGGSIHAFLQYAFHVRDFLPHVYSKPAVLSTKEKITGLTLTILKRFPDDAATCMSVWIAIILGIVEGLTEFLPVSSTGHLILAGYALDFTGEEAASFEIVIQLGAILSVVVYFRQRLWDLVLQVAVNRVSQRLALALTIAFVPAAILGLALHKWIEQHLFGPVTVAWALVLGGVVILIVEHNLGRRYTQDLHQINLRQAWWVGIAQCFSLFPGVSRSGATIIGGLLSGMDRTTATEFSFLLAIPTMLAATGYKIVKDHELLLRGDPLLLPLSLAVSFVTGLAVVAGFLTFVRSHTFKPFAYYRIVLGVIILALMQ
jgi:undecaprenyl-diphosphatase